MLNVQKAFAFAFALRLSLHRNKLNRSVQKSILLMMIILFSMMSFSHFSSNLESPGLLETENKQENKQKTPLTISGLPA